MLLGVITARAGSKGIPGKNMVDLGGKPLLDYTLRLAEECSELDRIVLTTDIREAAEWTRERYRRVAVPFLRPKRLSGPAITQDRVVLHAVDFFEREFGERIKSVALLQPTCPFRKLDEVQTALRQFKRKDWVSLVGVSRVWHHPGDYVFCDPRSRPGFRFVFRKKHWRQRQDFPSVYFMTGALYVCRVDYLRRTGGFYDNCSRLFMMSDETMIDIDSPFELEIARGLILWQKRLKAQAQR